MADRVWTEEELKNAQAETETEIAEYMFDDEEPVEEDQAPEEEPEVEEGEPDETEEDADDEGEDTSEDDDAVDDEQETEAPADAPQERAEVPSRRLREETERRRQIEAELVNARARIAAYEVQQQRSSPQQEPSRQEQPATPDIILDPEGWAAHQREEIRQEFRAQHVNATLGAAHEEHGKDFEAAYRALMSLNPQDPMARAQVQHIWNAPNPGSALMKWHKQQRTFNEIGDDPDAWFERRLQERLSDPETRRETLASMRNEAMTGNGGRPRTQTRLPRSLNSASGSGRGGRREADTDLYDDSDASAFEYAMR